VAASAADCRPTCVPQRQLSGVYDLVYVVVISEVGHSLASQVTWAGVGEFALAFTLVWVV
jgi:hypothetical protein